MNDEEKVLAEAENIINASAKDAENNHKANQLKHFVTIESEMFKQFKFDDEGSYLFHMTMVAETIQEVEELIADRKLSKMSTLVPPDDPTDIPNRAMRVELMAQGDVFEMLGNRKMSLDFANSTKNLGCIVRVAAFQSASAKEEGVKASEATDRKDALVTIMITDKRILTISRTGDDENEIHTMEKDLEDYEPETENLLDALVAYFIFPQVLKQDEPELFEALLKDYSLMEEEQ